MNNKSILLTKRQKEILIKLYNNYETICSDKMGSILIFKNDDLTIINSKSTNQLIEKGLIDSIHVGNHSSGYTLTQKGNNLIEQILSKSVYKPSHYAELFELKFLTDKFKTSSDNNLRNRYEVCMQEIDHWINALGLKLSNDFDNTGQKFKNKLFYHLKNKGWKSTKIKGRWTKTIFL